MKQKPTRIILHFLYWIIAWVFLTWFFTRLTKEFEYTVLFTSLILLIAIGTTYVFNYLLIPKLLFRGKYLLLGLFSLFTMLVSLWIELLGILAIFLHLVTKFNTGKGLPFFIDPVFLIAGLYIVVLAGVAIRLIRVSFSMQEEKLKLQNLKLEVENKLKESELNSMRTQFHPHFLFNTLNNLYWLTLNKSDQAPLLVMKLSDMLDYSLYRCKEDRVPLDQEIEYIRNYLYIMQIRFHESSEIRFDIRGPTKDRTVAPLIFITFVENACKHGLSQMQSGAKIHIDLEIKPSAIQFDILNNYPDKNETLNHPAGIGLTQVQSRLDLLYSGKHEFNINDTGHEYKVGVILYD
ncbi:MAG: histidine kinase [Bacteroidales bacterium]|jgi:hypothetical protein